MLPWTVAVNAGKALKGRAGFEDGHEVMNGAAREKIWLTRIEVKIEFYI